MIDISALTSTERMILSILEEAGEENVSSLINAIDKRNGGYSTVLSVVDTLSELHSKTLVEFALKRSSSTLQWEPISYTDAVFQLSCVASNVEWSRDDSLWIWLSPEPRLVALLTSLGLSTAKKVLRRDGWP